MDHFNFDSLKDCETVIVMSSTWESDIGLMPQNAIRFWNWLKALPLENLNRIFSKIKFAVCGFGSPKYRYFCGFATKLHDMFLRLGSFPILDLLKVDVDKPDRGQKQFSTWEHELLRELQAPTLPEPKLVLLPSVSQNMKTHTLSYPDGFKLLKVTHIMSYKKLFTGGDNYYYLEFSTEGAINFVDPPPDHYLYIVPRNDPSRVEKLVNTLYPGMGNTIVSLVPVGKSKAKDSTVLNFPSHLSVKELFEYYIDLSAHPAWHFVMQMESLIDESESKITDILEDPEAFAKWASTKTYFDVLPMYSSVMPSIEVLVTMLPRMLTRCYALLNNQDQKKGTLAIMFKVIPGGVCTSYLKGLKKGDKVIAQLGTSEFACHIDDLMQPFYVALGSTACSRSTEMQEKALAARKTIALEDLPLTLSSHQLFADLDRKPGVDETITQVLTITNMQKDKYRFTLAGTSSERFKLSFEPSSGVVKSKFSTPVKVSLTMYCTCEIHHQVLMTCEPIVRRTAASAEEGISTAMIPLNCESKLSSKLDFTEIKFLEQIGTGTYGTVSRGVWRGQEVAIKMLKLERVDVKEFQNECNLLQELRCPYVVNFVGYVLTSDKRCLLTEFVELGSLGKYIHGDLPVEYKIRVSLDCARGMSFLHNCGMMHRDLKPDNLLVVTMDPMSKVVVKLADFGTSREISSKEMSRAKKLTGGVGTPIYMAPEVLDGEPYSASADVYSFAMVMYELFTAKEPYLTPEFTAPWHIAQFVGAGKRLEIPADVPKAVADLISVCWAHEPGKRPSFDYCVEVLSRQSPKDLSRTLSKHNSGFIQNDWVSASPKAHHKTKNTAPKE